MAENRLPLLRGRVTSEDKYQSPQGGGPASPSLPDRDPAAHRVRIDQQLNLISNQIEAREASVRDVLAIREIVAVRPKPGAQLAAKQLSHPASDARLIGVVPETGTVLLDVADPHLPHLRKKLDAFADDTRARHKVHNDGSITKHRASERAIAPMDSVGLASVGDIRGPRLRAESLVDSRMYWFEVACRGGYRRPDRETQQSREQLGRQLRRIGASQSLDEFLAAEIVYFYLRLTRSQLEEVQAAIDCIYEVELAPPQIRDLKLLDDVATSDVREFELDPPAEDGPSVVVLDTGISTGHPLLRAAILTATTAAEVIPSPEDTYGHGTKMAGIALYGDLGAAIERGSAAAPFWVQSSRLLVCPGEGTGSDENYEKWPILTQGAVASAEKADSYRRNRVFVLAITRTMQDPPLDGFVPTLWSHAADQIAFGKGKGRLLIVSAGNARCEQWLALAEQHPQLQLSEKIHQPSQAANVLTVGAYTRRTVIPQSEEYAEARVVALSSGGLSPYSSTGLVGNKWPIKPDVVEEGGNLAIVSGLPDASVPSLCGLTTSHRHTLGSPLGLLSMTSEASARVGRLAASIWAVEPGLRPATVRALVVHSASWTSQMVEQFAGMNDRLQACGYGVPDAALATGCAKQRATIVIEDSLPNAVVGEELKKVAPKRPQTKTTETKYRRRIKLYRVPIPDELLGSDDPDVELRVTVSYFAEPNKFGRRMFYGLDLKWDMQGPQESEDEFLLRINLLRRPIGPNGKRVKVDNKKSFDWDVGIQARSRGTIQSDRWRGKMSAIVGDKLIAIIPVLGWWEQRQALKTESMDFSLVVSVFGPGVYGAIKPRVAAVAGLPVEV